MSNPKTLFMLIGPKGSGKTHIGTLVNQHTEIMFLLAQWIRPGAINKKMQFTVDLDDKRLYRVDSVT